MTAPEPPGVGDPASYAPIGRFQGPTYARNAFTRGTEEEVRALRDLLDLRPGVRLLDVGCGDGRHARRLAREGVHVTAVDVSPELIAAGRAAAAEEDVEVTWRCGDARELHSVLGDGSRGFDVVWSLCQGGLGTSATIDPLVAAELAAVVRPGGRVVVTLFHALFAARHLAPGDAFSPVHLAHHQVSEVRGPDHARASFDLWTAAYTVREGAALLEDVGLELVEVRGVEPGAYGRRAPGEVALDDPELLLVAARP